MPQDNDLRNDIVDDATSTTEFNDCDDIIVQARHVNLRRYLHNSWIPPFHKSLSSVKTLGAILGQSILKWNIMKTLIFIFYIIANFNVVWQCTLAVHYYEP